MSVAQVETVGSHVSKLHLFITFLLPDFHLLLMQLEFPVLNIQSKQFAFLKLQFEFVCLFLSQASLLVKFLLDFLNTLFN